jgi:serine/threonine protein kinase
MNRSIDTRSDLYSLGVTLYQMLTGSLPFAASEPMEWVHCHIARKPASSSERLECVPAQVSAIVMKLLAKTAEERYSNCRWTRARSSPLSDSIEGAGQDRPIRTRRTRHSQPAADPRKALWERP